MKQAGHAGENEQLANASKGEIGWQKLCAANVQNPQNLREVVTQSSV